MKKLLTISALSLATLFAAGILSSGCCSDGTCVQTKKQQASPITGTVWKLRTDSLSGISKTTEKPDRAVTFRIEKTGMVSGCAGVNRYFGSAVLDQEKNNLKFGAGLGATKMAGKGMAFEDAYLKMLSQVTSYDSTGKILRFLDKNGKVLAVFDLSAEK